MNNRNIFKLFYLNFTFALLGLVSIYLVDVVIKLISIERFYLINSYPYSYIPAFIILLIFSLVKSRKIFIYAVCIISLVLFCESLYLQYFGRFIPQQQINDLFSEYAEIQLELLHEPILVIKALVPAILNFLLFMGISWITRQRAEFSYAGRLLIIIQILFCIWIYFYESRININPQTIFINTYINAVHAFTMYISHEIPMSLSLKGDKTDYFLADAPVNRDKKERTPANIIFVMGESLGLDHMSVYGYRKSTTPFLDSLKGDDNAIFLKGISSSAKTSISVPYILNMIKRPNGVRQILSYKTNLFRLARENDFKTYYVTSTNINYLRSFINYMGIKYIDNFVDHYSSLGHDNILDEVNVDYLAQVDFTENNFIVLHMRGSHTPYVERYTKEFARYPVNDQLSYRENRVNSYDNSVLYTDYVIRKIYSFLDNNTSTPAYIVFTSDHGESLGKNGIYGHVNNDIPIVIRVPIIIISVNGADLSFIREMQAEAIDRNIMNHYEMSKLMAWMLGYDINLSTEQGDGYFVNGNRLDGSGGIIKLQFNEHNMLTDPVTGRVYAQPGNDNIAE